LIAANKTLSRRFSDLFNSKTMRNDFGGCGVVGVDYGDDLVVGVV
jgi:hypothetical protein